MSGSIKVRYEDGVLVPLTPIVGLREGDILEFKVPDPGVVYLCETDRLAALDSGKIVLIDAQAQGADSPDA
jgi:predicted DNA-binding antitoxin AbrB/MazE fold protein